MMDNQSHLVFEEFGKKEMKMNISSALMAPLFMILLAFGASTALSSCNTIEGMGEDTQAAGEATSETAREAEEELED
ncbi:MAG: entericidin A/B family lipoprotein [Pseudomonadota bacterium]